MSEPAEFSRRRAFLVSLGLGWAGYGGLGIIGQPRYGTSRGLADVTRYIPMDALGWMWVVCGVAAVLAGAARSCPRFESFGFVALAAPAGLWAGSFTAAAFSSYPAAIGSACGWGAFMIGVMLVSGMDDPPPPHLRKRLR